MTNEQMFDCLRNFMALDNPVGRKQASKFLNDCMDFAIAAGYYQHLVPGPTATCPMESLPSDEPVSKVPPLDERERGMVREGRITTAVKDYMWRMNFCGLPITTAEALRVVREYRNSIKEPK